MSYSDPDLPVFDERAIRGKETSDSSDENSGDSADNMVDDESSFDGGTPEEVVVRMNLNDLRGGVDGFFDTLLKVEHGEVSEEFGEDSMNRMLRQIEGSREVLAGMGVQLPNLDVNYDLTTSEERLHELGRWVYGFYDDEYPWRGVGLD